MELRKSGNGEIEGKIIQKVEIPDVDRSDVPSIC
jgi:hypothetical protein